MAMPLPLDLIECGLEHRHAARLDHFADAPHAQTARRDLREIIAAPFIRHARISEAPIAVARVAESGYDPVYGARPLKRALQKLVIDPLANRLLAGDFQPGDTIEADVSNGMIVFRKAAKGVAA